MPHLIHTLAFAMLAATGCAEKPVPTTIVGEWSAVAIHLPEGITGTDGSDRLTMEDYGEGKLTIGRDSTFASRFRISKDLRVTKRIGLEDVTTTLVNARTSSERYGRYQDSAGHLILEQPDIIHRSRFQLRNGVLITTSIIKGFPIQIIWHQLD